MEENLFTLCPKEVQYLIFTDLDNASLRSLRATGTELYNIVICNNFRIKRALEGRLPKIVDSLLRNPYSISLTFSPKIRPKISELYELTRLTNLKSLSIGAVDSEKSSWMPFTILTNLERFSTPTSKSIQILDKFVNTKDLELWIPDLDELDLYKTIVRKMTALESINIKLMNINNQTTVDLLAPIQNIDRITSFSATFELYSYDVALFGPNNDGVTKLTALKRLEWMTENNILPVEKLTSLEVLITKQFTHPTSKNLTRLELIPTRVHMYDNLSGLKECDGLKILVLRNICAGDDTYHRFLTALTALEELDLDLPLSSHNFGEILRYINSTQLTKLGIGGLKGSPAANFMARLTNLESLRIRDCEGHQAGLTKLVNLTKLIFHPPNRSVSSTDFIFSLTKLKKLTFFIEGELNYLDDRSLSALTNLEYLSFNDTGDDFYNSVSYLTKLKVFKYQWRVTDMKYSPDVMENVDPLTNLTNLRILHYVGNNYTALTRLVNLERIKIETEHLEDINENEFKGHFPNIETCQIKALEVPEPRSCQPS